MILSRFSKREKLLIIGTASVIAGTVIFGFAIEPALDSYGRLNRQIDALSNKLLKSRKLLENEAYIRKEYQKFSQYAASGNPGDEAAVILRTIEGTARKNNLSISNIRPQPNRIEGEYKESVFEIAAEANMEDMTRFIYELQSSGNLLRVTRLTISSGQRGKKGFQLMLEITKPILVD